MDRIILHSDLNSFYASVECCFHPELKDKPLAVCGSTEQRHGIILAKNEAAKKYGLVTGEAIWQAKQKCPQLITVEPNFERYLRISKEVRNIYEHYSNKVESFGLDECWVDVTGSTLLFGDGRTIAYKIKETIQKDIGITASIGVSWNKIFAKLGSDMKKPDAVTIISRKNFKEKVWPLPASDLLYVGRSTARTLGRFGIRTIGGLAQAKPEFLSQQLGKCGETLWAFANGYDLSPVSQADASRTIKSVGNSTTTYRDIENEDDAWKVIVMLSESVAGRLRENGLRCRTVQLSVRNTDLEWFERQAKLSCSCCTSGELAKKSMELLRANHDFSHPLRSLGVRACDLSDAENGVQLSIFNDEPKRERRERLESCLDMVRGRYGREAVMRAVLLNDSITKNEMNEIQLLPPRV